MAEGVRSRNIFDPKSTKPFKLSRSRIENFIRCPRCFYLDRRLGIDQPSGPPFTLNSAVDFLLKKEFDSFRADGKPHPIMIQHCVEAVPFVHADLDVWRENFQGVQYHHKPTNFIITGAVDDLWHNKATDELIVVDYKSTSKEGDIVFDQEWHKSYQRQMEIYQWVLRQNGFKVADRGYFVYANASKKESAFNEKLCFTIQLIAHDGKTDWVEGVITKAHQCLMSDQMPPLNPNCAYCSYRSVAQKVEK